MFELVLDSGKGPSSDMHWNAVKRLSCSVLETSSSQILILSYLATCCTPGPVGVVTGDGLVGTIFIHTLAEILVGTIFIHTQLHTLAQILLGTIFIHTGRPKKTHHNDFIYFCLKSIYIFKRNPQTKILL